MSLKRSLQVLFLVALPLAGVRFATDWLRSVPAEASSIPIVDRSYLVLKEVLPLEGPPQPDDGPVLMLGGTPYTPVGEPVIDLGHVDAGTVILLDPPLGEGTDRITIELTAEGAQRLSDWSATHVRHSLGIFVEGELKSAYIVMDRLGRRIQLAFPDQETTEEVHRRIRAGGAR